MPPFFELISLSYQIVKNLIAATLAFFIAILVISCIQSLGRSRTEDHKDYVFYFKENLNIPTFKTIDQPVKLVEREMDIAKPTISNSNLVINESSILKPWEKLKFKLRSINQIPKEEQIVELKKLREELLSQKLIYSKEIFRFYENEIQKKIYWTQKFMTVNELDFGEEVMTLPFESPLKKRKNKNRKVKGIM